jgi:hypothetical protein
MHKLVTGVMLWLVLSLTTFLSAEAKTLGELTEECAQLETFWRTKPPTLRQVAVPNQVGPAVCFGYLVAISDLRGLIGVAGTDDAEKCYLTPDRQLAGGPNCRPALGFCYPKGVTISQALAVFLAYARNHTAQWHEEAWLHYISAMIAAFPCKDGQTIN